jgi:putative ABC transport system substrate-binding protein
MERVEKQLKLLKELLPDLGILAVLSNTNHPGERWEHDATRATAGALSIQIAYVPFGSAPELEGAPERVRTSEADALLVPPEGVTMVHREDDRCVCEGPPPAFDIWLVGVLQCRRACQ